MESNRVEAKDSEYFFNVLTMKEGKKSIQKPASENCYEIICS